MSITVAKLIEYLEDVVDKEKPVKFGTWDRSILAHTNVSDFEGVYISATEVIITNGIKEVAEVKRDKEWLLEKIENYIPLHDRTVGDVINGILEIAKKLDEPEMKSEEKCYWILSTVLDCVIWHSDCGLDWQFSNPETPVENEMNYCPKCGKKLEVAE